jgi:hypothetical protein
MQLADLWLSNLKAVSIVYYRVSPLKIIYYFRFRLQISTIHLLSNPNNSVVILRFAILTHPAIVPIEGAVLFELPAQKQQHQSWTWEVRN